MSAVWQNANNSKGYVITVHHYTTSENYSIWIDGPGGYGCWRQGLTKSQALAFVKDQTQISRRTFSYILSQGLVKKILSKLYGTVFIPKVPELVSAIEIKK